MIDLLSSVVASTISTTALYPAQRTKIEMQLNSDNHTISKAINDLYNKYGLKGFYHGLTSLVIGNAISYGVYFVVYERVKLIVMVGKEGPLKIIICSGIAGITSSLATNPFWVLQTKEAYQNQSMLKSAKKLIGEEGWLSLWKGINTSLILVLNPIIQFCIYEFLKKKLKLKITQQHKIYDIMIFMIGAISKIISTLITFPYTLIRTNQHVNRGPQTLIKTIKKIYLEANIKGFYKGLIPKLIQTVLNSALMLMIYQKIRRLIQKLIANKNV